MYDIVIVGGGPAGLSASIYGRRANLLVLVIEKITGGAGQIVESHRVDNYLGLYGVNGYVMGVKFLEHAKVCGADWRQAEVAGFSRDEERDSWNVRLSNGEIIETKTVIYAAGARHRHLDVAGEAENIGQGVSYCATCDGAFYRKRRVAVIGGGDTALWDALYLAELAEHVCVVHRRDEFRGAEETVKRLEALSNVEFILNAAPERIENTDEGLRICLKDGRTLDVHGIFVAVGMEPETAPLNGVVELDAGGYVVADETGKTSARGFFVAGDVRTKALRQVVTAVSDGANAAVSAEQYIRKERQ